MVDPAEGRAELVHVHKVLRHVRGQHHIDEPLSEHLVRLWVEFLEDVHSVVGVGELEPESRVVILEDSGVVVENGKLTSRVAEER